ncbi:unnamed protein product [Withania somnifera]
MKKEHLDFELPMYDPSKGLVVDLAVVGGGPAGLAVAQQVAEAGLSVCSIDPSPKLIWPNNYGVWVDEFEAMDLLDCLNSTWSGAAVYSKMMQKCILNGVKFHQAKVIKVIHEEAKSMLICSDGLTIQAKVYDKPYSPGYEAAYGILAEVEEHPFDKSKMLFMDWRDSHLNNNMELKERNRKVPTFLYAMPFSLNRIFLEETSLIGCPGLRMDDFQERMVARLSHLGALKRMNVSGRNWWYSWYGSPLNGYMVTRTLTAAPVVANTIIQYLGSEKDHLDLWPIERRSQREFFCFGMNILLKLDLSATRRFFDASFDLEPRYWHGFLSSRLFLPELMFFGLSLFSHA